MGQNITIAIFGNESAIKQIIIVRWLVESFFKNINMWDNLFKELHHLSEKVNKTLKNGMGGTYKR